MMRRLWLCMLAMVGLIAGILATAGTAGAEYYEKSFSATVTQVRVNGYGGITISGTLDCTEQVAAVYGGFENIPEKTTVFVNVDWEASQTVGRTKTVHATYKSGIAHFCFNNDPAMTLDVEAPWSWSTLYEFPVGTEQWVYSTDGKFSAGRVHVELRVSGVFSTATDTYGFFNFSGWDLRAVKSR
jgi:hypothetical protein